jgi:hypothetical protein
MKKLIFVVIISLLVSNELFSQKQERSIPCPYNRVKSKDYISANFSTSDFGYGLRYDKDFNKFGFYITMMYTKLPHHNIKSVNNHIKSEAGLNIIIRHGLAKNTYNFLSFGLSYNYYFGYNDVAYDKTKYNIASFKKPCTPDIGTGMLINMFIVGVSTNFFTNEYIVNFGVKF